jgi:hypothetical protein
MTKAKFTEEYELKKIVYGQKISRLYVTKTGICACRNGIIC